MIQLLALLFAGTASGYALRNAAPIRKIENDPRNAFPAAFRTRSYAGVQPARRVFFRPVRSGSAGARGRRYDRQHCGHLGCRPALLPHASSGSAHVHTSDASSPPEIVQTTLYQFIALARTRQRICRRTLEWHIPGPTYPPGILLAALHPDVASRRIDEQQSRHRAGHACSPALTIAYPFGHHRRNTRRLRSSELASPTLEHNRLPGGGKRVRLLLALVGVGRKVQNRLPGGRNSGRTGSRRTPGKPVARTDSSFQRSVPGSLLRTLDRCVGRRSEFAGPTPAPPATNNRKCDSSGGPSAWNNGRPERTLADRILLLNINRQA